MGVLSIIILIGLLACVIFGSIYVRIGLNRRQWPYLLFTASAFSVAAFAIVEIAMMHAETIPDLIYYRHWAHITSWGIVVSFGAFVSFYLQAGRLWLFIVAAGLRTLTVLIDLFSPATINYKSIETLNEVDFLGETLTVANATPNPMMLIAQVSLVLFLVFCADASLTAWKRGDRRQAVTMGGSIILFSGSALVISVLVMWGSLNWPLLVSPFFVGIVIAMAYELTSEVLRADQLAKELGERSSEAAERLQALTLAADAGNVGVWMRDLDSGKIWATEKWREIFGFATNEELSADKFFGRIVADDREKMRKTFFSKVENIGNYVAEYRIELPDGRIRWIDSHGKLGTAEGEQRVVYGASADVTKRKLAELSIHDLGGRLIGAQEAERARLARELHDDLSQNLALLSIQLEMLGSGPVGTDFEQRIKQLTSHVQSLSSDVHRISHELHPAKLEQLGLVPAIRGFCREIEAARKIEIEFQHCELPPGLSKAAALCLYRVTQEALQNVSKHSGANSARVEISLDGNMALLTVTDNGVGFDPDGPAKDSLGLTSMQERVLSLKGTLIIDSRPGEGTRIAAKVPATLD